MPSVDPSFQRRLLQAIAALREDRLEDAERLASLLFAEAPDSPAVNQLAAAIAYRRGRFAEAERLALSCLAAHPQHLPALLIAGRAAQAAGAPDRAAGYFHRATHLAPDDPEAAFHFCVAEIALGRPAVDDMLQTLNRRFPNYCEGWSALGVALRDAGRTEAAVVAFARAAGRSSDPRYGVQLGSALLALSRSREAARAFRHVLSATPDFTAAMEGLARALRQAGDLAGAQAALLRLIEARPNDGAGYFLMGLVCEDRRDLAGAIAAYRRCAELQPEASEAHVNLGAALQQAGELEAALSAYRRAIALRPDTFARIAQALPAATKGQLWLDLRKLRHSLNQ
jgi:tetratricopeptide (TPR) repeat protein